MITAQRQNIFRIVTIDTIGCCAVHSIKLLQVLSELYHIPSLIFCTLQKLKWADVSKLKNKDSRT